MRARASALTRGHHGSGFLRVQVRGAAKARGNPRGRIKEILEQYQRETSGQEKNNTR